MSKNINTEVTEFANAVQSVNEKFTLTIAKPVVDDKFSEYENMIQFEKNMTDNDIDFSNDAEKIKIHLKQLFKIDLDSKTFVTTLKLSDDAIVILHDALSRYIIKDMKNE